jgi:hypothetical protein
MGTPSQEYRVVFDTGSGHLILPDARCKTDACLNGKKAYDMNASSTGAPINSWGLVVPVHKTRPRVNISFGTGGVNAQFVRDVVCIAPDLSTPNGAYEQAEQPQSSHSEATVEDEEVMNEEFTVKQSQGMEIVDNSGEGEGCVTRRVLTAMEMSTNPFYYFNFDGILGLGMKNLAVQPDFSYFDVLSRSPHITTHHFGIFLTEEESPNEHSEIAFGGINKDRVLEEVKWNNVVNADIGYWQVHIVAVRVGGVKLDVCDDGNCTGVVDTGTSHLGLPVPWNDVINDLLVSHAEDYLDCRLKDGPLLEFELDTINLTLASWNYMRRLPIREGIKVGSTHGVSDGVPIAPENIAGGSLTNGTNSSDQIDDSGNIDLNATNVTRFCRPRTMAVNLSASIGPKFFILGEPVLHKYYTVYDWEMLRVGFALANNQRNNGPAADPHDRGVLPNDVELLMQKRQAMMIEDEDDDDDDDDHSDTDV